MQLGFPEGILPQPNPASFLRSPRPTEEWDRVISAAMVCHDPCDVVEVVLLCITRLGVLAEPSPALK